LAALIEEPDPAGGKVVHRAHEFHFALRRAGPAFGRFEHVPNGPAHVGLDRRAEQLYDHVASEPARRLRIHTALSLEPPARGRDWSSVSSAPSWPAPTARRLSRLRYVKAQKSDALPANVHVEEFYRQSGALL
jgi:hypothetical protein